MPYFKVMLARLVRETSTVTVKAKSREDLSQRLSEVYELEESEDHGFWEADYDWTPEEGSHIIICKINSGPNRCDIDLDKENIVNLDVPSDAVDVDFSIRFEDLADDQVIVRAFLNGDKDSPLIFTADYTWQPDVDQEGNALVFRSREEAASAISKLVKDIR